MAKTFQEKLEEARERKEIAEVLRKEKQEEARAREQEEARARKQEEMMQEEQLAKLKSVMGGKKYRLAYTVTPDYKKGVAVKKKQLNPAVGRLLDRTTAPASKVKLGGPGAIAAGVAAMFNLPGGQAVRPISTGKKSSRGRGRPEGTFKTRVLPDGTPVRVPTHVYKKMVSAQKAQIRLQRELRMAQLSAQAPPDHVRGYGASAEDAWLMAEDMGSQMPQGMPEGGPKEPGMMQKMARGFRMPRFGMGAPGGYVDEFGQPMQGPGMQMREGPRPPMSAGMGPSGRLDFWGNGNTDDHAGNILRAKNIFNNPGETQVRP